VEIASHLVYELDPDGKQLRVVRFTDYTAEKVRTLFRTASELRSRWATRATARRSLTASPSAAWTSDELAKQPATRCDPLDLLCHWHSNAPLRTRRERAQRLRSEKRDFFDQFAPEARQILNELLDKYAEHGTAPVRRSGSARGSAHQRARNVIEIARHFGARYGSSKP